MTRKFSSSRNSERSSFADAKRDVARVMEVIKQIEEQSEITKPDVEVVELQHADANAVAALVAAACTKTCFRHGKATSASRRSTRPTHCC